MITVTVKTAPECESLLTNLPRGYEYELVSEDYAEDGSGEVVFMVHDVDELTSGMVQALNTHTEVIEYSVG
jgi:hypothetical protein